MEVDVGPGHIVLDGDPATLPKRGTAAQPCFQPMSIVAKRSPISATAEDLLSFLTWCGHISLIEPYLTDIYWSPVTLLLAAVICRTGANSKCQVLL